MFNLEAFWAEGLDNIQKLSKILNYSRLRKFFYPGYYKPTRLEDGFKIYIQHES